MNKNRLFFYMLGGFLLLLSPPVHAWNFCCESFKNVKVEARIAYYHPSDKKVRRIYGNGWPDYQIEFSKDFPGFNISEYSCDEGCAWNWRLWAGVSGFTKGGNSIGFEDPTRIRLIPVNLGVKLLYSVDCNTEVYAGGAVCYSFLNITDHSDFVRKHTRKEEFGGLLQSGIAYTFFNCLRVNIFVDYLFQRFQFHDKRSRPFFSSGIFHDARFIEGKNLNLNGFKIGTGFGITF